MQLETVNKNLQAYYDAWDKFVKAWIVIKIKDPNCVYQWRLQVFILLTLTSKNSFLREDAKKQVLHLHRLSKQ